MFFLKFINYFKQRIGFTRKAVTRYNANRNASFQRIDNVFGNSSMCIKIGKQDGVVPGIF